ncbi:mandelate racemase/muconate lactonizing enzyme family protein [Natronobacterium texcoconense]|uniref:glucarate dehydratase n=1 Tax=Natronobacterium texcoconense TaxID=1095778 RepID=A0A1H1FTL9_NATTX|nr:mandelate racemase/muconate lactonizing enzyme family protein [Natronobacterium texcoconense]SDR04294.1 L-alanine-DL-glutamate epimerase [Natronobacterium texcoconense]
MRTTVTSVEAIPVEVPVAPLEEGGLAPYSSNHDEVETVGRTLVRVGTDDGVTGWGEMLTAMQSARVTCAVIEDVIEPNLVGRRLEDIGEFLDSFYYPYVKTRPFLGAVETALWDALGTVRDASVSEMLGGGVRDSVDVAYCLGMHSIEDSRRYARRAVEEGFDVLKTKAGPDWKHDVERIRAIHEATDGELELRIDPNQGWSTDEAVRVGAMLEDDGIYLQYMEQPCRIDSYGTYERLRQRLRHPIAVNEDTYFPRNLYYLCERSAADVACVDLVPAGGLTAVREQIAVAERAGLSLTHHNGFDLGIKQAAVLHLYASTPALNLAPDSVYYGWADYILSEPLVVDNGAIAVPDGSGLGIDVDEGKVETYRID